MERQITPGVKRQIKALRKKYCEGLCSDFYLETGIPKIYVERVELVVDEIKPLLKENKKQVKQAIKNASKVSGRKLAEEERIVFI